MGAVPEPAVILDFWFGPLHDGLAEPAHRRRWFQGGAELDREITERFAPLIEAAAGGQLDDWLESPRGTLAFVLVCDQFPRHVHRGSASAFATDPLALEVSRGAVDQRRDLALGLDERAFLYLPFEHSESVVDQHAAVGLFARLRDDTPQGQRHLTGAYLQHAHQHRDVVLRFGRFPHRNAALGRDSTSEEAAFLRTGPSFGQGACAGASSAFAED
jgi:uncharacterized protein (DUF924 family)